MSRQFWSELLAWATADGTAVANSATEAIAFPDVTIPANYLQDGRVLKISAWGRWSNVVTAVPTLIFALRWGGVAGTIIAQTPAVVTPATAVTNGIWRIFATIQTRLNGAAGSVFSIIDLVLTNGLVPTFGTVANYGLATLGGSAGAATPAAVTVDLSIDKALSLTAKWSAANAANTLTGHMYDIQSSN